MTAQLLLNLSKLYTEPTKYKGDNDSFEFKLIIFDERCRNLGITDTYNKAHVISTMFTDGALAYSYTLDRTPGGTCSTYEGVCDAIRAHFEGPEFKIAALNEWNSITLPVRMAEKPEKSLLECFESMYEDLTKLNYKLEASYSNDQWFYNKLITACRGVEACHLACFAPPPTSQGLVNSLRMSIATKEASRTTTRYALTTPYEETDQEPPDSYYTERRYYRSNDRGSGRRPFNRSFNRGNYSRRGQYRNPRRQFNSSRPGNCWVCGKEDCMSFRHSESERTAATAKFQSRLAKRVEQYFNSEESDSQDDDEDYELYDNLIVDVHRSLPEAQEPSKEEQTSHYFCTSETAVTAFRQLADGAFIHMITSIDNTHVEDSSEGHNEDTEQYLNACYSESKWHGLLIDIGAARRSTVGFKQYQAFQELFGNALDTTDKYKVDIRFGIGTTTTIGAIHVETPMGAVDFYVAHADTPFLLSLADMDRLQIYYNSVKDVIISSIMGENWPVIRAYGHAWLLWDQHLITLVTESFNCNPCYLTDVELRRLHKRFGHPSVERLRRSRS